MAKTKEEILRYQREWYAKHKVQVSKQRKKVYQENKDKFSKYREEHREEQIKYQQEYRKTHKEEKHEYNLQYYENNKDNISNQHHQYYLKNKEAVLKSVSDYANSPAEYDRWYDKLLPYYNNQVQKDPEHQELIQFMCKYCGKWFNPTNQQLEDRYKIIIGQRKDRSHGDCELYCSEVCKKTCPTYGQILYPKDFKQNTSREVQPELRKMVLARDNWICQKCGKSKEDFPELELHCHHKYPLNENPIGSADTDNCITLCKDCHKWIHMNIPGCGYAEMKCSEKTQ